MASPPRIWLKPDYGNKVFVENEVYNLRLLRCYRILNGCVAGQRKNSRKSAFIREAIPAAQAAGISAMKDHPLFSDKRLGISD